MSIKTKTWLSLLSLILVVSASFWWIDTHGDFPKYISLIITMIAFTLSILHWGSAATVLENKPEEGVLYITKPKMSFLESGVYVLSMVVSIPIALLSGYILIDQFFALLGFN